MMAFLTATDATDADERGRTQMGEGISLISFSLYPCSRTAFIA